MLLLASFTVRRRGGGRRGRAKLARVAVHRARKVSGRVIAKYPKRGRKDSPLWANGLVATLWGALLLFMVGYAAFMGEAAMAKLDGFDLLTPYSMEP